MTIQQITRNLSLRDVLIDPDSSRPIYVGINSKKGAAQRTADWVIYKFTYDGTTSNVTQVQVVIGSWANRTTIF